LLPSIDRFTRITSDEIWDKCQPNRFTWNGDYGVYISLSRLAGRGLPSSPGPFSQKEGEGEKGESKGLSSPSPTWERGTEGVRARYVYTLAYKEREKEVSLTEEGD
jgi:hypothetical protein